MLQKYYIGTGMELNVVTDGEDYLIPGIAEQIERAGIHTADSISVCPTQKIPEKEKQRAVEYAGKLALALRTPCLVNIRFIYYDHEIYLFHASVTQSHSVPFLTKATGISAAAVATRCMLGEKLGGYEYGTGSSNLLNTVLCVCPFSALANWRVGYAARPGDEIHGARLSVSRTPLKMRCSKAWRLPGCV